MSVSHDSASTIVCKEVFDENSQPSEKEILDYAKRLGIDPDNEVYLLDLAREGLMAALPKGWTPVYDDATGSFYYYQRSTNVTTWEHPLDAVYKELVAQARDSNRHHTSVDKHTKTGIELTHSVDKQQQEATVPEVSFLQSPVSDFVTSPKVQIPLKMTLIKQHRNQSSSYVNQLSETPTTKLTRNWKSDDGEFESHINSSYISLSINRLSRDYTNLYFQDPEFYQSPRVVENSKKKFDLKDVFKRSESLSPNLEKDWKQLSSRFSATEENVIDIDNLNTTSLNMKSRILENEIERSDKKIINPLLQQQFQHLKKLTLNGDGAIFLKSNKSRDEIPCNEGIKPYDFQGVSNELSNVSTRNDEISTSVSERIKSILREKTTEDENKPIDEERKCVRFDLQVSIATNEKFNYSDSYEEVDTEPDERISESFDVIASKRNATILSLQQALNRQGDIDFGTSSLVQKDEIGTKQSKIVGRRFLVENVSEKEHMQQQQDKSFDEDLISNKFENIKNIDLMVKSDSEKTTPRSSSDLKYSFLNDLSRNKEVLLENMKKAEITAQKNEGINNKITMVRSLWSSKMLQTLEQSKEEIKSPSLENSRFRFEIMKNIMIKDHEQKLQDLKTNLDIKLKETKKYMEEEFMEQKLLLESSMQQRLTELKKKMVEEEKEEIEKFVANMSVTRSENLKKVKNELEICYEKEYQDILTNLKSELDQRKMELMKLREDEILKLESVHYIELEDEKKKKLCELQLTKQYNENIEQLKKELEKEFDIVKMDLRIQQREKITKISEDHDKCLADILRDFRKDEGVARKVYKQKLDEIRSDFSNVIENEMKKHNEFAIRQESVDFEKIRCQKRLFEDKYNTLKEKYLKLKNDMRTANEKRLKYKEHLNSAISETETSSKHGSDRTESNEQKSAHMKTDSTSNSKSKEIPSQNSNVPKEQLELQHQHKQRFLAANQTLTTFASHKVQKFASDDTTTCSETTLNALMLHKKKKCLLKKSSIGANNLNNNVVDNSVENIRKQLEKLEDLENQLPSNDVAYIIRYPFHDKSPSNVCSELEFFRHRIHVERDSVKRAREALRQQKNAFQIKQRAWKQQRSWVDLDQLIKEERDLSDMEVNLHRTRSLLGEKVIHLRYLEQSLERIASSKRNENDQIMSIIAKTANNDEMTSSDISTASSGFSSTNLATESTEIIASLENLNSEIREIWGVLNKRQDNSIPPSPVLLHTDLSWFPYQHFTSQITPISAAFGTPNIQSNILSQLTTANSPNATHNVIAQYGPTSGYTTSMGTIEGTTGSNLIEKTRNLKDWLRQAYIESSDINTPGQAKL